ncbi:MAG: family 20 glycosylhydrolase [Labilibaculum sp.]|nr:family 20 glycosylhydrolase [Labilibaculum sp.]
MKKLHLFSIVLLACFLVLSCTSDKNKSLDVNIIPYPNKLLKKEGIFLITANTQLLANSSRAAKTAHQFIQKLSPYFDQAYEVGISDYGKNNSIYFSLDTSLNIPFEGYRLNANTNSISVLASSENGLFYGLQSLAQLLSVSQDEKTIAIPALDIDDAPRFAWRGMHLDVSRHFMPTSFIKKYIDYLAINKLNVFHWHLVDGVGWRIEIKSHPELTDIGAWRAVKNENEPWKEGDDRPKYGGFYTQKEVKEIVKYAQERFITVLPEIELPGHSEIVFDCYPNLVCKDSKGKSLKNIGVYCASNPESYQLLEDVLDEVIDLFPSEYIHIGGDEVNKSNWKKCTTCRALMKDKEFDEKGLQSHFVNHFDKYLISKGRKLMGWHEILEGELSPSANIMFWGGMKEFENVLKEGHPTVLTTGTSYYFDHYQSQSEHEPRAWGGFTPLRQVYDLNPLSQDIDSSLFHQVLGIQANVWTEHMRTPERVEYMIFPRIFALSENAWIQEKNKSWNRFSKIVDARIQQDKKKGINCSFSAYRPIITTSFDSITKKLKLNIETELDADVYYTLDGSHPDAENGHLYVKPLLLDSSKEVRAISTKASEILTEEETIKAIVHKARGCEISLKNAPYPKYAAKGAKTLLDLESGGNVWGSGKWLGFLDRNLDALIQLDTLTRVEKVTLSCITDKGSSILFPDEIKVSVSADGQNYQLMNTWIKPEAVLVNEGLGTKLNQFSVDFEPVNCKYIKVVAKCPKQKNKGTFIFIDEIIVE